MSRFNNGSARFMLELLYFIRIIKHVFRKNNLIYSAILTKDYC